MHVTTREKVEAAVAAGYRTPLEVAAYTGIHLNTARSYLEMMEIIPPREKRMQRNSQQRHKVTPGTWSHPWLASSRGKPLALALPKDRGHHE
jgi:hypothetical protein